jgi:serine/threonine protein kinase
MYCLTLDLIVDCECQQQDISPELEAFLKKCFQRDPNRRPSAQELLNDPWIVAARERKNASGSISKASNHLLNVKKKRNNRSLRKGYEISFK